MKHLQLTLPEHLQQCNESLEGKSLTPSDLLSELSSFGLKHIQQPGCGPFVAAIQDIQDNAVLVVGANLVVHWNQSWAHAERVALALAQQKSSSFRLAKGRFRMLSTAQMCIACYGESLSSGLAEIITSASAQDVEELTSLREGVLPANWRGELEKQGIRLIEDFEPEKGRSILAAYGRDGQSYFNAG